jgi:hypothetical protein
LGARRAHGHPPAKSVEDATLDRAATLFLTRFRPRLLSLLAHIRNAQGRKAEALTAAAQGYDDMRQLETVRPSDASVIYSIYVTLLLENGQLERAREVVRNGRAQLYRSIDQIQDEAIRAQIATQPDNALLLRQAAQLLDGN